MYRIEKKDNFFRVRINNKWFSSYKISEVITALKRIYKVPSVCIVTP